MAKKPGKYWFSSERIQLHQTKRIKGGLLSTITLPSSKLVKLLLSGAVDVIVSINPKSLRSLHQVELYEDVYCLYRHQSVDKNSRVDSIFTVPSAKDSDENDIRVFLKKDSLSHCIITCGDFEAAKAMMRHCGGWAVLPTRVAADLVAKNEIIEATHYPNLRRFGKHKIVCSCLKRRANDARIQWVFQQFQSMLPL